ncbi:MAG: alpha/beta hydrolase [Burkholderiales bacterium]
MSYLSNSPLGQLIAKKLGGTQETILWNGDINDTVNIKKAIAALEFKILKASRAGKSINLVTHSMGTLVGYVALADLQIKTAANKNSAYHGVENFVTLASPLPHGALLDFLSRVGTVSDLSIPKTEATIRKPSELLIRSQWLNGYAEGDPIGGRINVTGVRNLPIIPFVNPHSLPYFHHETITAIAQALLGGNQSISGESATSSAPHAPKVSSTDNTTITSSSNSSTPWFQPMDATDWLNRSAGVS